MKIDIWNYPCPSIACHLQWNVCFSIKINTFSTFDLSGNLGFFWNLWTAVGGVDYWIIAYSLVEFPFLDYTGLYNLYSLAEESKGNGVYFFPFPSPAWAMTHLGPGALLHTYIQGLLSTLVLICLSRSVWNLFNPLAHGFCSEAIVREVCNTTRKLNRQSSYVL